MSGRAGPTAGGSPAELATWIFQANPDRYHIEESLRLEQEELWNLNQHIHDVRVGDRVLIWICGADPGIYAVGTVLSPPVLQADSPAGQGYWRDPAEGRQPRARVRVRYDRVLLDRPIRKVYLEADPGLWNLRILRSPRGTNFAVSPQEWSALQDWLEQELPDGA